MGDFSLAKSHTPKKIGRPLKPTSTCWETLHIVNTLLLLQYSWKLMGINKLAAKTNTQKTQKCILFQVQEAEGRSDKKKKN